jgi:hypothetical protein
LPPPGADSGAAGSDTPTQEASNEPRASSLDFVRSHSYPAEHRVGWHACVAGVRSCRRSGAFDRLRAVYVALYDKWGTSLHETRWISASADQYGANGSADPATGFHRGGSLTETFAGLCGASVMVRAFDQQTAAWSNWLDIAPIASTVATFGPNGSADPAMGFRAGC